MKLKVDHQADALYLTLGERPASESEEVSPGIIIDFDESGRAVGIEMLHLSKRTTESDTQRLLFESVPLAGSAR
jgi:uncharacterized protein YuzE